MAPGRHSIPLPIALLLLAIAGSCAHRTRIDSSPSGASVWVDGRYVGTTPLLYSTPATQLRDDVPVRLERPGYESADGHLRVAIRPSRIVGGFFTLGLVPLFKWPRTYEPVQRFALRPLSRDEQLADLDRRRDAGALTEEEYRTLRLEVLKRP